MRSTTDLARESIRGLADRYRRREVSPVEATRAVLDRIEAVNPVLNAYVVVTAEAAMEQARVAERALLAGEDAGPLFGIPMGIKDVYDTAGVVTTAGSKILAGRVPDRDAAAVARLRAAGVVIVGKTNTDEFALGGTTENAHYGVTRNPWNLAHSPGGSSGGSGAAVAAHASIGSIGSDTGGSIRAPAASCGIVGIKPTLGRVSTIGLFPIAWWLDTAGPMTKTVEDAALMLNVLAGYDPEDAGSVDLPVPDYTATLKAGVRGLRLGVAAFDDPAGLDHPDARRNYEAAVRVLGELGAELREVSIPSPAEARLLIMDATAAEGAAVHRRWLEERPDDYGPIIRPRLEDGRRMTAVQLAELHHQRRALIVQYRRLLANLDALVTPAMTGPAVRLGQDTITVDGKRVRVRDVVYRYLAPDNVTGLPAIVLPNGFTDNGLPTSLQITGRPWDEAMVLRVAHAYEQATPWHSKWPDIG